MFFKCFLRIFKCSSDSKFFRRKWCSNDLKRWKSEGARSGECGGCGKIFQSSSLNFSCVLKEVWGRPLSWWTIFFNYFLHFVQLFATNIRINLFTGWKEFVVGNSLAIPSNRQHNLLLMKVCLGVTFGGSWSFSFQIIIDNHFIVPSTQKMMIFLASNQQIADPGPTPSWASVRWPRRVRHPSESVGLINFANMVKNTFMWDLKITINVSIS